MINQVGVSNTFGIRGVESNRPVSPKSPAVVSENGGPQELFQSSGSDATPQTPAKLAAQEVPAEVHSESVAKGPDLASVKAKIENLQGLDEVKQKLLTLSKGLAYCEASGREPFHMISPYFVVEGPPGEQRTQVAHLLGELLQAHNVLPGAELKNKEKLGLGEPDDFPYVGQMASQAQTRVTKMVEDLKGNIGIVEGTGELGNNLPSYARYNPFATEFGHAAKYTLLGEMESNRGHFAMIVTDTPERMQTFFHSDPGLSRRFDRISLPVPQEPPMEFLLGPGTPR